MPSDRTSENSLRRIVLVAGPVKTYDRVGHHDYLGGCRLLAALLSRVEGVTPVVVPDGWPADEAVLDGAAALVFYDKGGGRQGFLASPHRAGVLERAAAGTGLVVIHQAAGFPEHYLQLGMRLLGGVYATGASRRGHWRSAHADFPNHPATRGVEPWQGRDGWLNHIQFVHDMRGVTPLLWSGKRFAGSPRGGAGDIVAWAFERPDGGRSFVFTGLDSHRAWSQVGLRRLVVGGVLWSAGVDVPDCGAPVEMDGAALRAFLTPRRSPWLKLPRKFVRHLTGRKRW